MKFYKNNKKIVKIIMIILGVIVALVGIMIAVIWIVFGEQITAAKTVKKLEDGLYYMEYKGDYGFDKFLEEGGASTDEKMAEYITDFLYKGLKKTENNKVEKDFGCSTLAVESVEGGQLFGRNYDWKDCDAIIVHTKPDNGYESVSTSCLDFLGYDEEWKPEGLENQYMALTAIYVPLDGINEKGLCVADLISGDTAVTNQNTEKKDLTIVSAIRLLLDKAASVDEAVELLKEYDMNSSIGTSHHIAISDTSGKSVVVEYIDNEMIVTETNVVTNHYLSEGEKFGVGTEESHYRFNQLITMSSNANGVMEMEELKECMKSVSYSGITQWSIVYDKENLELNFYCQTDYSKPYSFKIEKK